MNILRSKTAKNALWLIGEKIFTMSIGLLTISLIARYLGPENYGMLNYAISFVALFAIFSTLGLDSVSIKSIVQKDDTEGTILFSSIIMKLIGSIVIILMTFLAIWLVGIENDIQMYLIIIMAFVYLLRSFEAVEYWIQAYQNSRLSSSVRMIVSIISAILKIIIVFFDLGIIALGFVYLVDVILIAFGLFYVYWRYNTEKSKWKFSLSYVKLAFSQSWYLIVSGTLVALYTQLDKVLLGNMVSKEQLGFFMAALAVSNLWKFIPLALINSFKPVIMNLKKENEGKYLKKIQQMYSMLILINISCALLVFLFSDLIIYILYGGEYKYASTLLTISVWAGVFSVFGTARGIWMLCEGIQKYSIFYLGLGAVFSVCLNLLLIPKLGAMGAAITILLTEILTTVVTSLFFKKTRLFTKMFFRALILRNLK
ncbi:O-antigen/teichoic acid export membrane protein [Ammoniphilus resinae]|uniref:O-antigen/teichoic acid export membrane protein n=2 Tax=Ammoniphilus resinae TaxID=861532 RepID=A0ABS4GXH8_9BACL|nr:O-antigen/teichoic acid export membrane protein [Ammoniphilus resinae]